MGDENESYKNRERLLCPNSKEHGDLNRRVGPLVLEVSHNRKDEIMIWGWIESYVVHSRLLEEYVKQGFTGYRTKPAVVRFRDGSTSNEYHEFIVTGWAGIALPESGVQVVNSCSACHWKTYSSIVDYNNLIDWSQWTGEDFFMVWPLPKFILITEPVANVLQRYTSKSFRLMKPDNLAPFATSDGFTVARLSNFLPDDLAIKYGRPLGIE